MPVVHADLQRTVMDCNRHFNNVIRDARATFTSDSARRALDGWIELVIRASKEIQQAYGQHGFGASSQLLLLAKIASLIRISSYRETSLVSQNRILSELASGIVGLQDHHDTCIPRGDQGCDEQYER